MNTLDRIRGIVPAGTRATWYAIASALAPALVAWGALDEHLAPAVTGVIIATVTLAFALVHSTSPWRRALYGVAAAVAVLAVAAGWATTGQTEALLAIIAPVLGTATAAATTNGQPPVITVPGGHPVTPGVDPNQAG